MKLVMRDIKELARRDTKELVRRDIKEYTGKLIMTNSFHNKYLLCIDIFCFLLHYLWSHAML